MRVTKKGLSPLHKFFQGQEKFFETRKYFPRVGINFRRAGKNQFCQEKPGELKSYTKNFDKKTNTL